VVVGVQGEFGHLGCDRQGAERVQGTQRAHYLALEDAHPAFWGNVHGP